MTQPLINCAECGKPTYEDDLIYNDEIGSDVCEDCDAAADEENEATEGDDE